MSAPTPATLTELAAKIALHKATRAELDRADRAEQEEITRLTAELEAAKRWRPEGEEEITVQVAAPIWRGARPDQFSKAFRSVGLVQNPLGPGSVWAVSDGYMLVLSHASTDRSAMDRAYTPEAVKALTRGNKQGISGAQALTVDGVPFPNLPDLFPEVKQVVERVQGPIQAEVTLKAGPLLAALSAMFGKATFERLTIRFQNNLIELESEDAYAVISTDRDRRNSVEARALRGLK